MKNYTLILFLAVTLFACSKSPSIPEPEPDAELVEVDTTLAGKLKLKITDSNELTLNKVLLKDSKGNYVIEGKKSGKHWIGCFDKDGNEIQVKAYSDDPVEIIRTSNDIRIPISYQSYRQISEIGGAIFIVRRLFRDSLENSNSYFVQDLTKIDIQRQKITNEYRVIIGDEPYIHQITPWYESTYRISTYKNKIWSHVPHYTYLYDSNDKKIGEFETTTGGNNSITDYLAISETRFISIRRGGFVNCWNNYMTDLTYETSLTGSSDHSLEIELLKLVGKVIEVTFTTVDASGIRKTVKVRLDAETGSIL